MSIQIPQENFGQMNETANQVTQIIFEHTKSERGVHVETAVSAPCRFSGTLLLQATGIDISKLEPGQPVFFDAVYDAGRDVHSFAQKICTPLGIQPFRGWSDPVPDDHQPLESGVELVRKIEGLFVSLMEILGVPNEYRPNVAAFTGMKIIPMGKDALNPEIGKAIALSSLVAGSKTIPFSE